MRHDAGGRMHGDAAVPCRPAITERRRVKDWNIVVTIYQESFRRALRALQDIGPAEPGPYHNVLVIMAWQRPPEAIAWP